MLLVLLLQATLISQEPVPAPTSATPGEHALSEAEASRVPEIALPRIAKDAVYEVRDFGALGNGTANDTAAINLALAACSAAGGGTVHFPAGTYLAASIHLKSRCRLKLEREATITGDDKGFDPPEKNEVRPLPGPWA